MRRLLSEYTSEKHLPAKLAVTHTEFNHGVGVDLFMLADSDEQVFEFLNMADLATRFNICFPVPSKRPDDVLSGLTMKMVTKLNCAHKRKRDTSMWPVTRIRMSQKSCHDQVVCQVIVHVGHQLVVVGEVAS